MKTKLVFFLMLILISVMLIGFEFFQTTVGPHGGQVKEVQDYNIEMKSTFDNLYAFLLDKKLKPISNKGIFCEVQLTFPDNISTDITLKPFQEDGFISETNTRFSFCKITFNVYGKTVSAMFQNETLIVKNK